MKTHKRVSRMRAAIVASPDMTFKPRELAPSYSGTIGCRQQNHATNAATPPDSLTPRPELPLLGAASVAVALGALLSRRRHNGVRLWVNGQLLVDDWVDYWAVDFDYESRKEIIKVAKNLGVEGALPGTANVAEFIDFEERWTGSYIFENEWQTFRTRQNRNLELTSVSHTYAKPGRYVIAVKVIDIFGNDTMTLLPVSVG